MGQEISLFNDYHTKENILSNHCGVILKLLYEENPQSFEEAISILTSQDFLISPSFKQQIKKQESVPDIVIEQKSFSIYFETKRFDWFTSGQIDRHLKGFKIENDYNILLDKPLKKSSPRQSKLTTPCRLIFTTFAGAN